MAYVFFWGGGGGEQLQLECCVGKRNFCAGCCWEVVELSCVFVYCRGPLETHCSTLGDI